MGDAVVSLAPAEGPEEAPLNAAAIRRCGAASALSTRIPRLQGSGSSGFSPLFVCVLVAAGWGQLSLKCRRGREEEEEAADARGLSSVYEVNAVQWVASRVCFGLPVTVPLVRLLGVLIIFPLLYFWSWFR